MGFFVFITFATLVVTGALAERKGFAFLAWVFSGVPGLLVLAFMPHLNRKEGESIDQETLRRAGNVLGGFLQISNLAITGVLLK